MRKRNIILISTLVVVILAVLGLILGFSLSPIGLSNRKNILINAMFGDEKLTLDVKMVKGIYNPDYNGFNSDYTLLELCKMRADKTDGEYSYTYDIYGDNAIIYKIKDGNRVAFAELCDISALDKGQKYLFTNGTFRIGESEITITAPYHLVREQVWGSAVDTIKLNNNIDFNAIIDFYKFGDYYKTSIGDNSLAIELKDNKGTVVINYNAEEHSIHYLIASNRFR